MSQTNVVLLGTGTPNADPDRFGPATAIVVNDTPYVIDAGPGVVRRAAAAHRNAITGLAVPNLKRLFFTHLHSDHSVGYPDFILTPWVLGRDKPLEVFGPVGTQLMTDHLLTAYQADIRERLRGLEPANEEGYKVIVHEIGAGVVYRDENVIVEAFPVQHGSWPAFGYKFRTPDKVIVHSGDTRPDEHLIEQARGCDMLIHEVYSAAQFPKRPPEWQKYHASVHTSTIELAEIASKAQPKLLVLVHQLFWGISDEALVAEVRTRYDGEVVCGKDLDVF